MSKWWLPFIAPVVGGVVAYAFSGNLTLALWLLAALFAGGLIEKYSKR